MLHPVAIVAVESIFTAKKACRVDVAADKTMVMTFLCSRQRRQLESPDKGSGLTDPAFDPGRQRPVRLALKPTQGVEPAVQAQQQAVGAVSHQQHQRAAAHHLVELVAMADQKLTTVGGGVHCLVLQLYAGEGLTAEAPEKLVVITGNVYHPGTGGGELQQLVDNLPMTVREMGPALHGDQVDNVAYQVQRLAANVVEEIQQVVGLAIGRSQMNIGNEYAAIRSHGASRGVRPAFGFL